MSVMILTEHHFEFPSLKGDCTGSSESTLVKMPQSLFGKQMSLLILILKAFKLLTDRSKAELLYLCSPLTYCLVCVLQPCVHLLGKGLRPASPVRQVQHLLDPLFWPSMLSTGLSTVFLYLVSFFFFELASDFI